MTTTICPPCRVCGKVEPVIEYPGDHPERTICPDCCGNDALHHDGEKGHVWEHDWNVRDKVCDRCGIERRHTAEPLYDHD